MASLPPLARLRLGASTGSDADSDEEHAYEPLDRRAYRKFPKLAPAPDVTTLATMPLEVIEILIEKTAIAARDEAEPARFMCEWMKVLCRTAKLAGVTGCADHWYYLALAAFGFTPAPAEVAGEAPTLPAYSGFTSWRAFFGALCEAFYGTGVKRFDAHQSREWRKGEDAFFRYVRFRIHGHTGEGNDVSATFLKHFLDPNATQRALDTRLDELLDGEVERRTWARAAREAGSAYQSWIWRTSQSSNLRDQEQKRMNLSFVHWINELDSELSTDASPWAAVVTLFVLRGAKPGAASRYRVVDANLYHAVATLAAMMDHNLVQSGGVPGSPNFVAESLASVRKSLEEGADPNYTIAWNRDEAIYEALHTRNEELLALMLDHGAHVPYDAGRAYKFFEHALNMMFRTPTLPGKPWPYGEGTTATLVAMLVEYWKDRLPDVRRNSLTRIRGYVLHPATQTPAWLCNLWKRLLPNIETNSI
jgi:hypothetical protein